VEIVPPEVNRAGVKIYNAKGEEIDYNKLDGMLPTNQASQAREAIKEVYNNINKLNQLENFQPNKIPNYDLVFKADGSVVLTPDKPIKGKSEFTYKLKNTAIAKQLSEL
jgi:hypothetical protein